jgi:ParB family chromosome partitioning protein
MTRKVLGRGLDALIPQVLAQPREAAYATPERPPDQISMVPIDRISANPHQPRSDFDPSRIEELAQSIREMGILEPLILRAVESGGYELIAGERRLRAAQVAGRTEVPALIRDFEGLRSLEVALVENLQREDLNPVDEAKAYQRLVEDFGRTHAEISKAVGKDRTTITNLLRLLRLPADVLQEVSRGTLSVGNARVLLSLTDPPGTVGCEGGASGSAPQGQAGETDQRRGPPSSGRASLCIGNRGSAVPLRRGRPDRDPIWKSG